MLKEGSLLENLLSRQPSVQSSVVGIGSPKHTEDIMRIFSSYPGFKLGLIEIVKLLHAPIDDVSYLNEVMTSLNYLVLNNEILMAYDDGTGIQYLRDSVKAFSSRRHLKENLGKELGRGKSK